MLRRSIVVNLFGIHDANRCLGRSCYGNLFPATPLLLGPEQEIRAADFSDLSFFNDNSGE